MKLSHQQNIAFDECMHFLMNTSRLAFAFSGVAGSGKSTIIKQIINVLNGLGINVAVVAPTGRAASVLVAKGVADAKTVHRFMYQPVLDPLTEELLGWEPRSIQEVVEEVQCILCDESSMVTKEIFNDLIKYNLPILFVGDAEQLPPVGDDNFNIMSSPNIHLTEVHRQAEGNPIIMLSKTIRETGLIDRRLASDKIIFTSENTKHMNFLSRNHFDMILCGTNRERLAFNRASRAALGYRNDTPERGERIMCLRNRGTLQYGHMYNGELYRVDNVYLSKSIRGKQTHMYDLFNMDTNRQLVTAIMDESFDEIEPMRRDECGYFTYGYATTVHKAQGSQFNNVLFRDEDVSHFIDQRRFRYTAVTRAVDRITIQT